MDPNSLLETDRALASGVITLAGALFVAFAVSRPTVPDLLDDMKSYRAADYWLRVLLTAAALFASAWAASEALLVLASKVPTPVDELLRMTDAVIVSVVLGLLSFVYSYFGGPLLHWAARDAEERERSRAARATAERERSRLGVSSNLPDRRQHGPRIAGSRRRRLPTNGKRG